MKSKIDLTGHISDVLECIKVLDLLMCLSVPSAETVCTEMCEMAENDYCKNCYHHEDSCDCEKDDDDDYDDYDHGDYLDQLEDAKRG